MINWIKKGFQYIFHNCHDNFVWKSQMKGRFLTRVHWKECTVCKSKFDEYSQQH